MTGHIDKAITDLLAAELPALFGGATPAVQVATSTEIFTVDAASADPEASQPRTDDRTDNLPFNAANPQGPYTLTQPADPTPRKVRLTTAQGDRIALADSEVIFDAIDSRRFTLRLRSGRDVSAVNGVQVLYGVIAVFVKIKYAANISITFQAADAAALDRAESLGVGAILLNLPRLVTSGAELLQEGNYSVQTTVKSLELASGSAPAGNSRRVVLNGSFELKATRALSADEGRPIVRIRTASEPIDPRRPIDIKIDVEA